MVDRISYPRNYFDPYGDEPTRAQCAECGERKDISDMDTVEMVPCLVYGEIAQGICQDCADKERKPQ